MILTFIFTASIIVGLLSIVSTSWGGKVADAGALYEQDRRRITSRVLDKRVGQLYEIRSQGKELKDKSAQGIFEYDKSSNMGIQWNDLNNAEKSQYEFLSQHIQSDAFKNGSK